MVKDMREHGKRAKNMEKVNLPHKNNKFMENGKMVS